MAKSGPRKIGIEIAVFRNQLLGEDKERKKVLLPWPMFRVGGKGARIRTRIKMLQFTDQSEGDVRNEEERLS